MAKNESNSLQGSQYKELFRLRVLVYILRSVCVRELASNKVEKASKTPQKRVRVVLDKEWNSLKDLFEKLRFIPISLEDWENAGSVVFTSNPKVYAEKGEDGEADTHFFLFTLRDVQRFHSSSKSLYVGEPEKRCLGVTDNIDDIDFIN